MRIDDGKFIYCSDLLEREARHGDKGGWGGLDGRVSRDGRRERNWLMPPVQ